MKVAAIDIGTNTFLCLIAEVHAGKVTQVISDEIEIVRIGEGVNRTKKFSPEALKRADHCLKLFSESIKSHGAQKTRAVATSAARDAQNSGELISIGKKYGIAIEVISGEQEARLTFEGVMSNPEFSRDFSVVDVGGGSTEVTYFEAGRLSGRSFDVGGVRLTEMFVSAHPIQHEEVSRMRDHVRQSLASLKPRPGGQVVGVAGTPTTLAALELQIDYKRESIEGYGLPLKRIDLWIDRLAELSLEERSQLKGLEPKRADIIVAGAIALAESTRALGADSVLVSTRGIRYGAALEAARL